MNNSKFFVCASGGTGGFLNGNGGVILPQHIHKNLRHRRHHSHKLWNTTNLDSMIDIRYIRCMISILPYLNEPLLLLIAVN